VQNPLNLFPNRSQAILPPAFVIDLSLYCVNRPGRGGFVYGIIPHLKLINPRFMTGKPLKYRSTNFVLAGNFQVLHLSVRIPTAEKAVFSIDYPSAIIDNNYR